MNLQVASFAASVVNSILQSFVIKMLLAGASAVQMASIFYKKGPAYLGEILKGLETWMDKKGYESIGDFKGRLSLTKAANPALYERAQYLSSFGGYAGS